jgi:hypothetical protein
MANDTRDMKRLYKDHRLKVDEIAVLKKQLEANKQKTDKLAVMLKRMEAAKAASDVAKSVSERLESSTMVGGTGGLAIASVQDQNVIQQPLIDAVQKVPSHPTSSTRVKTDVGPSFLKPSLSTRKSDPAAISAGMTPRASTPTAGNTKDKARRPQNP